MPVYPKGDGKWLVRVHSRGRPVSWVVDGSKADAQMFEARKRVELAVTGPPRSVPGFWAFCRDHYSPSAKLRLKAGWYTRQRSMLATLALFFGEEKLDRIDSASFESFARFRRKAGLRTSSVNNECRVLARVLSFAREQGYPVAVPRWTPLVERDKRAQAAWTDAEVAALLDSCARVSPDLVPVVVFLANTGCRRGEAIALRWEDVDLARGYVRIQPSPEWQPKNGKPREVPISRSLLPWLQRPQEGRHVFPSRTGAGWACWPARAFDRARDDAGLEGGAHRLRHTFASNFLAAVPDLYLLARVLGHSDVAVTRLYAHLLPDHLARARGAVEVSAGLTPAGLKARLRWTQAQIVSGPSPEQVVSLDGATPKKRKAPDESEACDGAGYRARTDDIQLGKPRVRSRR